MYGKEKHGGRYTCHNLPVAIVTEIDIWRPRPQLAPNRKYGTSNNRNQQRTDPAHMPLIGADLARNLCPAFRAGAFDQSIRVVQAQRDFHETESHSCVSL